MIENNPTYGGSSAQDRGVLDRGALDVLVVCASLPNPPDWGFAKRVFHLVEQLARGNRVTMVTQTTPDVSEDAIAEFAEMVDELIVVPRSAVRVPRKRAAQVASLASRTPFHAAQTRDDNLQEAVTAVLARKHFDTIQLESSQLGWLKLPPAIPVVLDEHNIESELLGRMARSESSAIRRLYNGREYRRYRRFERDLWQRVTACATTSRRDAQVIERDCPNRTVEVVPNGVDTLAFQPAGAYRKDNSIVFTGLLDYRPNVDGIKWFLNEVYPLIRAGNPYAHLTIIGGGPQVLLDSLRGPGVTVAGRVPEVQSYLDAAAVIVVPLRIGGGTRLKVVEAMSMAGAIVSTSQGAEGIDVVSGTHLELADDPRDFAEAVLNLMSDPIRAARLGAAARELAQAEYSWDRAGAHLEALHRRLAGAANGRLQPHQTTNSRREYVT